MLPKEAGEKEGEVLNESAVDVRASIECIGHVLPKRMLSYTRLWRAHARVRVWWGHHRLWQDHRWGSTTHANRDRCRYLCEESLEMRIIRRTDVTGERLVDRACGQITWADWHGHVLTCPTANYTAPPIAIENTNTKGTARYLTSRSR